MTASQYSGCDSDGAGAEDGCKLAGDFTLRPGLARLSRGLLSLVMEAEVARP